MFELSRRSCIFKARELVSAALADLNAKLKGTPTRFGAPHTTLARKLRSPDLVRNFWSRNGTDIDA